MLKNVLEANGYEMVHYMTGKVNSGIEYMTIGIDGITQQIGDKIYPMEWDKERHYEERAKQYVRENGFKLSWLEKVFYERELEITKCNSWYVCKVYDINFGKELYSFEYNNFNNNKINVINGRYATPSIDEKLIAWLYSEDIKIVEGE